ncbi:hypothetical protein EV363DRAFT_1420852 [Boletus edulis]|nr:hypothetical protein EV363DRAFT_1420852 [Boletus edulis]
MNKLETGPGGQRVVQGANRDVKCKTKHGSDTDCIHMIRRGDGKGTATSAVHCDSKRVETGTLAIYQCRNVRFATEGVRKLNRSVAVTGTPRHVTISTRPDPSFALLRNVLGRNEDTSHLYTA